MLLTRTSSVHLALEQLGAHTESPEPARGRAPLKFLKDLPLICTKLTIHPRSFTFAGSFQTPPLRPPCGQSGLYPEVEDSDGKTDKQTDRQPSRHAHAHAHTHTHTHRERHTCARTWAEAETRPAFKYCHQASLTEILVTVRSRRLSTVTTLAKRRHRQTPKPSSSRWSRGPRAELDFVAPGGLRGGRAGIYPVPKGEPLKQHEATP